MADVLSVLIVISDPIHRLNTLHSQLFGEEATLRFFEEEEPGVRPPARRFRALARSRCFLPRR